MDQVPLSHDGDGGPGRFSRRDRMLSERSSTRVLTRTSVKEATATWTMGAMTVDGDRLGCRNQLPVVQWMIEDGKVLHPGPHPYMANMGHRTPEKSRLGAEVPQNRSTMAVTIRSWLERCHQPSPVRFTWTFLPVDDLARYSSGPGTHMVISPMGRNDIAPSITVPVRPSSYVRLTQWKDSLDRTLLDRTSESVSLVSD